MGDFVRHSDAYYRWRIENRLAKPVDERTPMDYDDIAVAYDKLGQQDKAIETIYEKIRRFSSESVYESEANLGTFLIHAGHLEEGLVHIDKAIEINSDAHFGREIYQKLLVEYLLQQRAAGNQGLPLATDDKQNFATFLAEHLDWSVTSRPEETQKAITGILGMMRFGHYDSPILLEALGDLLMTQGRDANMLAAQAYLRATILASDQEGAAAAYYAKAEKAMELQHNTTLQKLQKDLSVAVKQADKKFAQIEADEIAWSAADEDLDQKFASKYYEQPLLRTATLGIVGFSQWLANYAWMFGIIAVILVCIWGLYRWLKADLAEAAVNPPKA
ncbi:hypothetical protein C5Y96_05070 [Blastopirellula marina]|uniref:Uncharacterized protein n=1 Tax=Blastopirellula marina TaxID=124 RepID=A0A2S8G4N5_9BACT|nr:hypothetical protein C5Y96_05070 [Blastopirellula marina]RCS55539.1 hypothetical protein DTL36_05080 [Bremerella cremea]